VKPKPLLTYGSPQESYKFPAKRLTWEVIPPLLESGSPLRTSHLRDPLGPDIHFASESFMDEVAFAAGMDPVEFRLQYVNNQRDKELITALAEKAGWQKHTKARKQRRGDIAIGDEMIERRQKAINEAFLVTLTQVLVAIPRMTAAEAMLRSQEKARLLAPTMGRQQSEFLGPMVERELDLLDQMGWLPPMPAVLKEAGGLVDVEYTSPLNKAQRAEEGLAIVRTIESATTLAQVDPTIMFNFDGDAIVRELAEINGVPEKLLRPVAEVLRMKETMKALNPTMLAQAGAMVGGQAVRDLTNLQITQGLEPLGAGLDLKLTS
jgi:hypothetical protein